MLSLQLFRARHDLTRNSNTDDRYYLDAITETGDDGPTFTVAGKTRSIMCTPIASVQRIDPHT